MSDHYLKQRGNRWHYVRRLPVDIAHHYSGNILQRSLKTSDLAEAKMRRDAFEEADEAYWQQLRFEGKTTDALERRYEAAVKRAAALSYKYRPIEELAAHGDMEEILRRLETARQEGAENRHVSDALLGLVETPKLTLESAFKVMLPTVAADRHCWRGRNWKFLQVTKSGELLPIMI